MQGVVLLDLCQGVCARGRLCIYFLIDFDVITSHGKLDRGSKWKNVTSHAQGRAPT